MCHGYAVASDITSAYDLIDAGMSHARWHAKPQNITTEVLHADRLKPEATHKTPNVPDC